MKGFGGNLLDSTAVMRWLTPSKKKNLETMKVLTSIEKLAQTQAKRIIMLMTRMMLRTIYPGPARDFSRFQKGILNDFPSSCSVVFSFIKVISRSLMLQLFHLFGLDSGGAFCCSADCLGYKVLEEDYRLYGSTQSSVERVRMLEREVSQRRKQGAAPRQWTGTFSAGQAQ